GQWSTGARVLDDLAEQGHPLPRKILDWRQVSKLKSTYTDALPGYVDGRTHRVHTSYALAATPTGRLSSSEPNLQNIPTRNDAGPGAPSPPPPATSWCPPTTRRSSCGSWPRSPISRSCEKPSAMASTSMP